MIEVESVDLNLGAKSWVHINVILSKEHKKLIN